MGDSATAMRDPVFYRWHAQVDDMFQEFKATLPQYQVAQVRTSILFPNALFQYNQFPRVL